MEYESRDDLIGLSYSKIVAALTAQGWGLYDAIYRRCESVLKLNYGNPNPFECEPGSVIPDDPSADPSTSSEAPADSDGETYVKGGNVLVLGFIGDKITYSHYWYASGHGDTSFRIGLTLVNAILGAATGGFSSLLTAVYNATDKPLAPAAKPVDISIPVAQQANFQPIDAVMTHVDPSPMPPVTSTIPVQNPPTQETPQASKAFPWLAAASIAALLFS